ncbi:tetratricopeptide repeat protein [Pseudomonadota bacterium]
MNLKKYADLIARIALGVWLSATSFFLQAQEADLRLVLLFDGNPLQTNVTPNFSCRNYNTREWLRCNITKAPDSDSYLMPRPSPGLYTITVEIDNNPKNPGRHPGDYIVHHQLEVNSTTRPTIHVHMEERIHMTQPDDNNSGISGTLGPCETKPVFETKAYAYFPTADIPFTWDTLVPGTEYHYVIFRAGCPPRGGMERIIYEHTLDQGVTLSLPPNKPNEYYFFRVTGEKDGRRVGDFRIFDGGSHGPQYRFRVINTSLPQWVYQAVLGLLVVLLIGIRIRSKTRGNEEPAISNKESATAPKKKRKFDLLYASIIALAAMELGIALSYFIPESTLFIAPDVQDAVENSLPIQTDALIELQNDWRKIDDFPDWWDSVMPYDYPIKTYSDILGAWKDIDYGSGNTVQKRRFVKSAHRAIASHPQDLEMVAHAIMFSYGLIDHEPYRTSLLEFGLKHFEDYKQNTHTCSTCGKGDLAQKFANHLAYTYMRSGDYENATATVMRVYEKRKDELNDETHIRVFITLAAAQRGQDNLQEAINTLMQAAKKFELSDAYAVDQLNDTLKHYRERLDRQKAH